MLLTALSLALGHAHAETESHLSTPSTYEQLVSRAAEALKAPYSPSGTDEFFENRKITPAFWSNIRLRSELMPWNTSVLILDYPAPFLPFRTRVFWVEQSHPTEVPFSNALFSWPNRFVKKAPENIAGFSGIRFLAPSSAPDNSQDSWMMFLGDKSFRAKSTDATYGSFAHLLGSSLKGGEDETAISGFSELYIDGDANKVPEKLDAWVDNEAVVGGVHFVISKTSTEVTQEVEATFYVRQSLGSIDISPLVSSFSFSESERNKRTDIHPEIHDADGALIRDGEKRSIFRTLRNPNRASVSEIPVNDLKGFGLVQRDRDPEHYLDASRPDTRVSVWIEPILPFGPGLIRLTENPDEGISSENIQMSWRSGRTLNRGEVIHLHYRIHWSKDEQRTDLARCRSTRYGRIDPLVQKSGPAVYRFRIEYDAAKNIPKNMNEMHLAAKASHGTFTSQRLIKNEEHDLFFVEIDYIADEKLPADLELSLLRDETPISEIWHYRFEP